MTENKRLTFSQREEKEFQSEPMRLEHISQDFRNQVWFAIDKAIRRERERSDDLLDYTYWYMSNSFMRPIIFEYTTKVLHWPHDHMDHIPSQHQKLLRSKTLEGSYDIVLTLIEFILRQDYCPPKLYEDLENAFRDAPVAYFIQIIDGLPTIVPRFSKESGATTQQAVETIEQKGPAGAKTHFRFAAKAINEKRYADALRESIDVVESVVKIIDPKASNKFGLALNSLEKKEVLKHPALKASLGKLYAYASDEEGIRHSLSEKEAANVDLDDAVFMFGVCASFAAYLVNRHEQVKSNEEF